jgi:hypothetical protein
LPHPLPHWRLVILTQRTSRPVLRAWRTAVTVATDGGELTARGVLFSAADGGEVATGRVQAPAIKVSLIAPRPPSASARAVAGAARIALYQL